MFETNVVRTSTFGQLSCMLSYLLRLNRCKQLRSDYAIEKGAMVDLCVMRRRGAVFALSFMLIVSNSLARAQVPLPVMPLPATAVQGTGSLLVDPGLQIVFEGYTEPRLERARTRFFNVLSRETGAPTIPARTSKEVKFIIKTAGPSAIVQQLREDESYHLEVTATGVLLTAPNPLGILHGLQTFLQLVHSTPEGYAVATVTIDDKPRFPWRGLMIDTGRHFIPLEVIRENLDGMEAVKMNVFHWHLSEDQGFRIESKIFPLLQEKGSDGLYYTQDQVRGILQYARDRGIRVVPEFDMPCHTTSWFVGYPDLASGSGPYQIERRWGVFDPAMDPTRESTYQFLDQFVGEMTALFPDAYFHIGGDECNGKEWDANPRIKKYMQTNHLRDNAALQAYFTGRVQKLVAKHHKTTVGWDEVLQSDTPHDVVIQSWRGPDSLAEAARRGYRGILSAGYYLDLNQSAADHYAVDPLANGMPALSPAQRANILGGEATMWTEFVSPENINSRIWPRAAAIAERLWSTQDVKDINSMYRRLDTLSQKLAYYDLPYQSVSEQMLRRLSSYTDSPSLQVLASVVQPPRDYAREDLKPYDVFSPLNRLVDTVPPESDKAREFNEIAARIAAGKAVSADWQKAHQWLVLWRDNDAVLQPLLTKSSLTTELVPLSRNLSQTATIGLFALDTLQNNQRVSVKMQKEQMSKLKELENPEAVLVNMVVPGVEVLVRAARTR
ncbi:MAG TPA: family 20 glycosylhydrolase [Edaphobacter sp.]|uniref:family 20 glycosylhydrolase n=1 Tax=Edaphobacter sp. TaxID=1934404 RepID=UPI002BF3457E|nr:family 20 glycosylhydrolase [Edaphobacter sp.]HUZ95519.1 family 20 glycosylhydrolase [Edaphobacter sp.]